MGKRSKSYPGYHNIMKLVLFAVLLAACLPAAAADTLPDLGDASQSVLSLQQERQLGEAIMRQIRMNKQYVNDPELADYINGVGYRLAAASPNAAKFRSRPRVASRPMAASTRAAAPT